MFLDVKENLNAIAGCVVESAETNYNNSAVSLKTDRGIVEFVAGIWHKDGTPHTKDFATIYPDVKWIEETSSGENGSGCAQN